MSPQLYLISRPVLTEQHTQYLEKISARWIRPEPATAAELIIEFSGRICYMAFGEGRQRPRSNAAYIQHLIESGHDSVLEHASWTFLLTGVSRAFSHQFVRHRIGFSFSQLSQQYHDESAADFVRPLGLEQYPGALEAWHKAVEAAADAYRELLKVANAGAKRNKEQLRHARSIARSILPNATSTTIAFSANARSLRNFLHQRGATVGDLEMRAVSALLLSILKSEAPSVVADFEIHNHDDGLPIVTPQPFPKESKEVGNNTDKHS